MDRSLHEVENQGRFLQERVDYMSQDFRNLSAAVHTLRLDFKHMINKHLHPIQKSIILGTNPSFPTQYIVNTLQGNGQCTWLILAWYTISTFKDFPANFPIVSLVQQVLSTLTVYQAMWLRCPN